MAMKRDLRLFKDIYTRSMKHEGKAIRQARVKGEKIRQHNILSVLACIKTASGKKKQELKVIKAALLVSTGHKSK